MSAPASCLVGSYELDSFSSYNVFGKQPKSELQGSELTIENGTGSLRLCCSRPLNPVSLRQSGLGLCFGRVGSGTHSVPEGSGWGTGVLRASRDWSVSGLSCSSACTSACRNGLTEALLTFHLPALTYRDFEPRISPPQARSR